MTFHPLLSSTDNSYWKTSITAYLFLCFPQHLFNLEFNMHWVWNLWLQTWVGKIILFSIMKITLYLSPLSFGYMWFTQDFLRQFMVFLLPLSSWWYLSSGELTKYQGIIGGYFSPCLSFLQNSHSYWFSASGPTDNCCLFSVYLFFSPCWSTQGALYVPCLNREASSGLISSLSSSVFTWMRKWLLLIILSSLGILGDYLGSLCQEAF